MGGQQCCELAILSHCLAGLRKQSASAMPFHEINLVYQAFWELLDSEQHESYMNFVKANCGSIYDLTEIDPSHGGYPSRAANTKFKFGNTSTLQQESSCNMQTSDV